MKKTVLLFALWIGILSLLSAQTSFSELRPVNQATLFGVGKAFLNDSYLSPLRYDGITVSLFHERMRGTSSLQGKLLLQHQFLIQTSITKNPTATASEYYGNLDYRLTGFYPLYSGSWIRVYGGAGGHASLGGIYNVRNSNNPGSLKTEVNLQLSALAVCNWRVLTFRWQLSMPFAGLFFSPEFGHSYYEIFSLGNDKGTVNFGSFHNQQVLRNYFSVDVPLKKVTFRAAYLGDYGNVQANDLITRIFSHQFMFGFAVESLNFGGEKARRLPSLPSAYY